MVSRVRAVSAPNHSTVSPNTIVPRNRERMRRRETGLLNEDEIGARRGEKIIQFGSVRTNSPSVPLNNLQRTDRGRRLRPGGRRTRRARRERRNKRRRKGESRRGVRGGGLRGRRRRTRRDMDEERGGGLRTRRGGGRRRRRGRRREKRTREGQKRRGRRGEPGGGGGEQTEQTQEWEEERERQKDLDKEVQDWWNQRRQEEHRTEKPRNVTWLEQRPHGKERGPGLG